MTHPGIAVYRRWISGLALIGVLGCHSHFAFAATAIVTGSGATAAAGGPGQVRQFDGTTLGVLKDFRPYDSFAGGVRVAVGDVNGDGVAEIITGPGDTGSPSPQLKVFNGVDGGLLQSYLAYAASFTGGVYVATGDINGDGKADIVTGAGDGGNTEIKVFNGVSGAVLQDFNAFSGFSGGVRVAVGDVNGDRTPDIIAAVGIGGPPQVKVFDGKNANLLSNFFAYSPNFGGGVHVATGDVNGDGFADIITGAGPGGATNVKAFSGATGAELLSFLAYSGSNSDVRVAAGDVNGDGTPDIITGLGSSTGGGPLVKVFDGRNLSLLRSFFAYGATFDGGVYVAATVPEPPTLQLLILGSAGLAMVRIRSTTRRLRTTSPVSA